MSRQKNEKRTSGRVPIYANSAERSKAWRTRQKALIAQASLVVSTEPKVIEKIIEKPVYISPPKGTRAKSPPANANKLIHVLRKRLTEAGTQERAKTLRVNTARVASVASDLLELLRPNWRGNGIDIPEKEFLEQVEQFFSSLNESLKSVQHSVKAETAKRQKELHSQHEQRRNTLIQKTFGRNPTSDFVIELAKDLLAFNRNANAWLVSKFPVDKGYFPVDRSYQLENAIRSNDIKAIMQEIAEVRDETGEQGRMFSLDGKQDFKASWAEFESWRREKIAKAKNA